MLAIFQAVFNVAAGAEDTPTAVLVRQVLGAIAQFEKIEGGSRPEDCSRREVRRP
jgi:hypothetical protein